MDKKEDQKNKDEKPVSETVVDKVVQSITTGLGLVTALAWNEAIQGAFNRFLNKPAGLAAKFIYALILTIAIVIAIFQLQKMAKKASGIIAASSSSENKSDDETEKTGPPKADTKKQGEEQ